MKKLIELFAVFSCLAASAGELVTWTATLGTNDNASAFSNPFTGEIDEISVYAIGNTGAVSIVSLDPFSGDVLVIATNAATAGRIVFTPRKLTADMSGNSSLVITNLLTADRLNMQGERLKFTVGNTTTTGTTFRATIKTK
jgi:hypothetical protein